MIPTLSSLVNSHVFVKTGAISDKAGVLTMLGSQCKQWENQVIVYSEGNLVNPIKNLFGYIRFEDNQ